MAAAAAAAAEYHLLCRAPAAGAASVAVADCTRVAADVFQRATAAAAAGGGATAHTEALVKAMEDMRHHISGHGALAVLWLALMSLDADSPNGAWSFPVTGAVLGVVASRVAAGAAAASWAVFGGAAVLGAVACAALGWVLSQSRRLLRFSGSSLGAQIMEACSGLPPAAFNIVSIVSLLGGLVGATLSAAVVLVLCIDLIDIYLTIDLWGKLLDFFLWAHHVAPTMTATGTIALAPLLPLWTWLSSSGVLAASVFSAVKGDHVRIGSAGKELAIGRVLNISTTAVEVEADPPDAKAPKDGQKEAEGDFEPRAVVVVPLKDALAAVVTVRRQRAKAKGCCSRFYGDGAASAAAAAAPPPRAASARGAPQAASASAAAAAEAGFEGKKGK